MPNSTDCIITKSSVACQGGRVVVELTIEAGESCFVGAASMLGDAAAAACTETAAQRLHRRSALARHPLLHENGTLNFDAATRAAVGLLEAARLDALCQAQQMPLHLWLGGALRPRLKLAAKLALTSGAPAPPHVRRVVLTSDAATPDLIVDRLAGAASKFGPDVELALQLNGQLSPDAIEQLREAGRRLKLAYIADPCAEIAAACAGFARGAPPLALTAHRYPPRDLAKAMRDAGVQIVLVDPVRVGGPEAVRMFSTAAVLTGVELGAIAHDDSAQATYYAARIAATLPGFTQPLVTDATSAADLAQQNGMLALGDASPARPTISRVTLHRVSVPMRQLYVSAMYMRRTTERIVIEIETSDGLRGFGETNGIDEVLQSCERMARKLIGQCPLDRLRLRHAMAGSAVGSRNGLNDWAALAGLDMALFDWAGRYHDQPIWRLLGGEGRPDFEAVAHIPALLLDEPVDRQELPRMFADPGRLHELVEHAVHLHRDPGFTAFKLKCTGTSPAWDVAVLRALRVALGDDVKLRWDPNASYPPAQATVLCQQLEELNLEYYEDPTSTIASMAQLRARMQTPLATNMCLVNFDHLATALRQPCVDVVLADLVMWGGPQSMVELGDVTPLFGFEMTIHSAFELGLGMAANLQIAAAVDPVRRAIDFGLENMVHELIVPHIPVHNGRVAVPDGPGLGVEPNWDEVARYKTDTTTITA
jgi:glucarate dehydratase